MIKHKNTRLAQQIKQIKILLGDFKKARSKCLELASALKLDLNKDNFYSNTERTTLMKCELLDLPGLVQVKNSLVKVLGELFDQQREYEYQLEKKQTQHRLRMESAAQDIDFNTSPSKPSEWSKKERYAQSMNSSRTSELRMSRKVEVPFYKVDQDAVESVETKLDRVSKFIASLKKSMKGATETTSCKFRTKEYLLEHEDYIKAKAQLQKYLMREEEMERIIQSIIKDQIQQHFQSQATLTPDGEYYLIRVPKSKLPHQKTVEDSPDKTAGLLSPEGKIQQKEASPSPQKLAQIKAQAEADFEQIKVQLQRKTENYAELFSQMNDEVERGNERLSQLRQKRKLAFQKDDQLWDEL